MELLRARHRRDWHEKIHAAAASYSLMTVLSYASSPDPKFPWERLDSYTEVYLRKKGRVDGRERDTLLRALIEEHGTLHHEELHFCVAACAGFMSPEAVKSLLAKKHKAIDSGGKNSGSIFLATIAAHRKNSLAVTKSDSDLANTLIRCLQPLGSMTTSQQLEMLIKHLIAGISSGSFAYVPIIALTRRISEELSNRVGSLRASCKWLEARAETEWLLGVLVQSKLGCNSGSVEAAKILEETFPDWQKWAEWKPCDTELARHLVPLPDLLIIAPEKALEFLIRAQMAINPRSNSYVYENACMTIKRSASDLASQVAVLKASGRWLEAHKETAWLSTLLEPLKMSVSGAVDSIALLNSEFPEWKSWACWDEQDSELAKVLHSCLLDPQNVRQHLEILIRLILAGIRKTSVLYSHIFDWALKLSNELSITLQALKADGRWFKAYKEASYLLVLQDPSSETSMTFYSEAVQVLDKGFAEWKAWAMWKPDINRLQAQERLPAGQRRALLALLALEGPDFESSKQTNMREGLLARDYLSSLMQLFSPSVEFEVVLDFEDNARNMLERLSEVVAAACRAGSDAADLLAHFCCCSKPIDNNALRIVEGCSRSKDTMIAIDVLHILKAEKKDNASKVVPVMRLLPKLNSATNQALREALTPCIVEYISTCMREMQSLLPMQIEVGSFTLLLHAFGESLRTEQWLLPLLDVPLGILIRKWPSSKKFAGMNALQLDIRKMPTDQATAVSLQLNRYYAEYFIEAGTIDQETKDVMEILIDQWVKNPSDSGRMEAALRIARVDEISTSTRLDCLSQLSNLSDKYTTVLLQILESAAKEPGKTCVSLARLLAILRNTDYEGLACWSSLLFDWCANKDSLIYRYTTGSLKIEEWHQWISNTQLIFPALDAKACPKVLRPVQQAWASRIRPYTSVIHLLENIFGTEPPSLCFRTGFESQDDEIIIQILQLLKDELINWDGGGTLSPTVHASLALLKQDSSNARQLHRVLSWLSGTTTEGNDVYLRIIAVSQGSTPTVASVLLAGWLENPKLPKVDRIALESLSDLLGIRLSTHKSPDIDAGAAEKYISNELAALYAEAKRLANLRRSLRHLDPEGLSELCLQLGIESSLEDEIADLPNEMLNVVEMVDADTVELHFPLDQLTALTRAGMGTGNAQNLIVRLVRGNDFFPARVYIHLDTELDVIVKSDCHSSGQVLAKPANGEASSRHCQMNRTTYQLRGIIAHHCLGGTNRGIKPLKEIYTSLKLRLDRMLDSCVTCGPPHGVKLHRPYPCKDIHCRSPYDHADFNIQLIDLIEDPQVADLLLTAVQAAITSKILALLPRFPYLLPFRPDSSITGVLETLPPLATWCLSNDGSRDLGAAFRHLDEISLKALAWILDEYGGFLVSATGKTRTPDTRTSIKIPSMPGTYQFLLINAAPQLEKAFALKKGAGPSTIVFHGTSLDRLYPILCQGLKILSHTPFQKTGALRGKGIYVAETPSTAWSYASEYVSPREGMGWKSRTFDRFHVLLACEASGIDPGQDFHVVKDPETLILRYIFLTPPGMKPPQAAHIVPAITSVCSSLRSGAL